MRVCCQTPKCVGSPETTGCILSISVPAYAYFRTLSTRPFPALDVLHKCWRVNTKCLDFILTTDVTSLKHRPAPNCQQRYLRHHPRCSGQHGYPRRHPTLSGQHGYLRCCPTHTGQYGYLKHRPTCSGQHRYPRRHPTCSSQHGYT